MGTNRDFGRSISTQLQRFHSLVRILVALFIGTEAMQTQLFSDLSGATFSTCNRYRYALWRTWSESDHACLFLMLNPSTADESVNDPTVERCQRYAQGWGYGGLVVCNLFAFRATDPALMKQEEDPAGPENDAAILDAARRCGIVVCAWGNHGSHLGRAKTVVSMLMADDIELHALKITGEGHPGHPLYLKKDLTPVVWDGRLLGV